MLSALLRKIGFGHGVRTPDNQQTDRSASKNGEDPSSAKIPTWQIGDTILNRYRVERVMSGAMGTVYISEHLGWGIKVAIKSPKPEVLADREGFKRIIKEANRWVRMDMHPNVASCYYVLAINKIPHLFIEYVDGGSLSEWISSGRCRDLRNTLSLAIQFCHGMEFTHRYGIIHRDVKPANILITKGSLLKITDFGILLARGEKETESAPLACLSESDKTGHTEGFRGTLGYASPEQLRNAHAVDQRTDIFSFGLCLWLMFCGSKPFVNNALNHPIPEPVGAVPGSELPASLKEVLKKSVAFDPDQRYQDFVEMRQALNAAYLEAFKTPCPYMDLSSIDLKADSLNNRAVSLFELNETEEAAKCLLRTVEINDMLPEAVYNLILFNWRSGASKPERILRQIEASKKRGVHSPWLNELEVAVKRGMMSDRLDGTPKKFPEYRLCIPQNSLNVFRDAQLHLSVQRNVLAHLENRRYAACHEVMMAAWQNRGYRKDPAFNKAYDGLIRVGRRGDIVGVQRFLSLKGHGSPAGFLVYIPETRKVISAGANGKVLLCNLGSGSWEIILDQEDNPVTALATCPLGRHLAVGGLDGTISIVSPKNDKIITSENAHRGPVHALAFDATGKYLASGGADGILKVRKLFTGPETSVSINEGGAVRSLVFIGRQLNLASGSEDGSIRLWESGGKNCTRIIEAHAMPVNCLSSSADGLRFASASADRTIKLWEHGNARIIRTIKGHDEEISSLLFLPDNQTLASGCVDDMVKLWNQNGECVTILDGRGDGVLSLARGPKPHTFLAGRKDGGIVLWMIVYQLNFEQDGVQ